MAIPSVLHPRISAQGNIAQVREFAGGDAIRGAVCQAAAAANYLWKDRRKKPRQARSGAVKRQEPER